MQKKAISKFNIAILCAMIIIALIISAISFSFSTSQVVYASTDWTVENGTVISYTGTDSNVVVPEVYDGQAITKIGKSAFKDNQFIEEVQLRNNITQLGQRAFENCANLKKVALSSSLTKIDDYTFNECRNLSEINIPESVKVISTWAFGYCESLSSINLPLGMEEIGSATFYGCKILNNVTMPDSIKKIGTHSFRGCEKLSELRLSNNLETIPFRAFSGCSALSQLTLPSSLKSIGDEAFYQSAISVANIPSGVESIGSQAFYGCKSLKEVNLPNNIKNVGASAFYGCESIGNIVIPDSVTLIEADTFNGCKSLVSVTLSKNLTGIKDRAFNGCYKLVEIYNLSNLNLEIGATTYGNVALYAKVIHDNIDDSSLIHVDANGLVFYNQNNDSAILVDYRGDATELVLPDSFNGKAYDVGQYAFAQKSVIKKITIPNCVKVIGLNAFYKCSSTIKVFYNGTLMEWQSVQIGSGNDCLQNVEYNKVNTDTPDEYPDIGEGFSFFDKLNIIFNQFINELVSNIFVVNFLLLLLWGAILIYGGGANKNRQQRKKIFVIIACIQWVLISGLRADSVGADTENYMNIFDHHSTLSWERVFLELKNYLSTGQSSTETNMGLEPLFIIFNKAVSVITVDHVAYKFIVAIIFMLALGRYIYKYSEDPCLSFAIYGSLFFNMFSLTGYRQVLAVSLILFAFRYIRERKFWRFLLVVLLGSLIHRTNLMFILLYVMANKKITPMYLLTFIAIFLSMIVFNSQLFTIVKNVFGYDEYVGNYGFKQHTFTLLYIALTVVSFWKYKEVVGKDSKAIQYYNGLLLSWLMFPFVLESPSAMRLVYNFGFVILLLVPKIVKAFKSSKEKQIVYLAIYGLFGIQVLLSDFTYAFYWM